MDHTTFPRPGSRGGQIVPEKRSGANRGGGNNSDITTTTGDTKGSPSRGGGHKRTRWGNGHG